MDNSSNPEIRSNKKRSRGCDEDRISKLPDSLLQHILSFVSTKDAIRTSVLSLRWRNIWTLVPCIDLESFQFSDDADFLNFTDRRLDLHGNSYLRTFMEKSFARVGVSYRLEAWIKAAIMCKVEHLKVEHVELLEEDLYLSKMPQCLCVCNTLVVLKLQHVILDIPKLVSLSSLKIMHFKNVTFMDAGDLAFKSLIFGCPVLEELSIKRIYEDNLKVLSISSQTLKRLRIHDMQDHFGGEYGMVIDAPHLQDLTLSSFHYENFAIRNLGSVQADIDVLFNVFPLDGFNAGVFQKRSCICRFLAGISNVKRLKISSSTFKILSEYMNLEALPQFHNLFHLESIIQDWQRIEDKGWGVLPAFLKCCPNLKSLVMSSGSLAYGTSEFSPFTSSLAIPQCMLSSLESVTLQMAGVRCGMEMDMIKYFLENSAVLKEVKVLLSQKRNLEEELLISNELSTFPKRSTACRVYVNSRDP